MEFNILRTFIKRVANVVGFLIISGCASTINYNNPLEEDTVITQEQGLLVASILNATNYPTPINYLTITPENLNESTAIKPERLVTKTKDIIDKTVFASPLKAGRYSVSSLYAYHGGGSGYYSHFVPVETSLGVFEIKPGQVTDLGTIAYYRRNDEDVYFKMALRVPDSNHGEVLDKHFRFFEYDKESLNSWSEDGKAEERNNTYIAALQNPTTHANVFKTSLGTLYFPAPFGVIIERTTDGDWLMGGVEANLKLTKFAENDLLDIVAAGAEGRIFVLREGGIWDDISLPTASVVHQLIFTKDDQLDVLASHEKKLTIYRTNVRDHQQWVTVDSYTSNKGWASTPEPVLTEKEQELKEKIKAKPTKPKAILAANYLEDESNRIIAVATIGDNYSRMFSVGKTKKFSVSGDWNFKPFDKNVDTSPQEAIIAGNIEVELKKPTFWDVRTTYVVPNEQDDLSYEISSYVLTCNGEYTQSELCLVGEVEKASRKKGFTFTDTPWFENPQEALALVTFSSVNFWTGSSTTDAEIVHSKDGGKTWSVTGYELPQKYCSKLIGSLSDRIILSCAGLSGDFYESTDKGKTWTHVRQHETF